MTPNRRESAEKSAYTSENRRESAAEPLRWAAGWAGGGRRAANKADCFHCESPGWVAGRRRPNKADCFHCESLGWAVGRGRPNKADCFRDEAPGRAAMGRLWVVEWRAANDRCLASGPHPSHTWLELPMLLHKLLQKAGLNGKFPGLHPSAMEALASEIVEAGGGQRRGSTATFVGGLSCPPPALQTLWTRRLARAPFYIFPHRPGLRNEWIAHCPPIGRKRRASDAIGVSEVVVWFCAIGWNYISTPELGRMGEFWPTDPVGLSCISSSEVQLPHVRPAAWHRPHRPKPRRIRR